MVFGSPDDNGDGIPDSCPTLPGDFNNDGKVDGGDLGLLLSNWGTCAPPTPCLGDLDGDDDVDGADLGLFLSAWTG